MSPTQELYTDNKHCNLEVRQIYWSWDHKLDSNLTYNLLNCWWYVIILQNNLRGKCEDKSSYLSNAVVPVPEVSTPLVPKLPLDTIMSQFYPFQSPQPITLRSI